MGDRTLSSTPWHRLSPDLIPVLSNRLDATVAAVGSEVTMSLFSHLENRKIANDVNRGVRVALERFLELIGTDLPALTPPVRETFVELGAAEAREDRTPERLLSALRIAARVMLRALSDAIAQDRPLATEDLIDLSDAITTYVDELAAAGTDGFALQLREQAGESDRRRRLLAELLLRGNASEHEIQAAAEGIGWRRIDSLVPVILPPAQTRHARFRFRTDAVVIEREHDSVLMMRDGPLTSRQHLTQTLLGRSAVVGPTVAWKSIPEAIRLTELLGLPESDQPVFVTDHLATLALRGERTALVALSERRLAVFADLKEASRERLLDTLHSWLRRWGSRAEVATDLQIHPQTVSYRIRQLRDMLGDDLDDAGARFELHLALADRSSRSQVSPQE